MDEEAIWTTMGEEGFELLTEAFYKRVRMDEILGPMYPEDDWEGAEKRLAGFLKFRFGGEMGYVEERGHPRLRMRHMPFTIGERERDRWLELMEEALKECEVIAEVKVSLLAFFAQVADFMRNK